jgi:hypothetical protein
MTTTKQTPIASKISNFAFIRVEVQCSRYPIALPKRLPEQATPT